MSMTEILEELPRLGRVEREKVWQRLEEIELGKVEETPEMLAAIDVGASAMSCSTAPWKRGKDRSSGRPSNTVPAPAKCCGIIT